MSVSLFPLATFAVGVAIGALIGSSSRVRRWLRLSTDGQAGRNDRVSRLLGVVILVVVGTIGWESHRVTECQYAYNRAFVAGLAERTAAAEAERQANRIRWTFIIEALRNPIQNPTPEQKQELGQRWLADLVRADQLIDEADARRAANPVQPPSTCG